MSTARLTITDAFLAGHAKVKDGMLEVTGGISTSYTPLLAEPTNAVQLHLVVLTSRPDGVEMDVDIAVDLLGADGSQPLFTATSPAYRFYALPLHFCYPGPLPGEVLIKASIGKASISVPLLINEPSPI